MGVAYDIYRGRNDFNFPKWSRWAAAISTLLVVVAIGALVTNGLNLSLDFQGGSLWEIPSEDFTQEQAEAVMADAGLEGAKFQEATSLDGERVLRVTGQAESVQAAAELAVDFAEAAGLETDQVAVNTVGPSWGKDITQQARTSLIVFMVLITAYIAWRLEARMAASAIVAVVHDILITIGVYALFSIEVTPATVISFLTILGFSLYDTIVVYDRLQENGERFGRSGRYTYTAITRRSLNQVFMRSINTSVVTLLPIISLLVFGKYVFGQQALLDFSLALLIGLLAGVYSSIFIAAPLTSVLKERETRWREIRERLRAKGADLSDTSWHGAGPDSKAASTVAADAAAGAAVLSGPAPSTTVPPRPRKKRR